MKTALLRKRRGGSAVARFAANGLRPDLVITPTLQAVNGVPGSAYTHSRAGNATVLDADGLLKWAPHNLLNVSENFDAGPKARCTISTDVITAPNGTMTADAFVDDGASAGKGFVNCVQFTSSGGIYTGAFFAKKGTQDEVDVYFVDSGPTIVSSGRTTFNLNTGTVTSGTGEITALSDGWFLLEITSEISATGNTNLRIAQEVDGGAVEENFYLWGAHVYRSDLGGMQSVPVDERGLASSSTYLPTTSTARYLPRRNAYTYVDGVLTGPYLQHESAAATNLIPHSTVNTTNWIALLGGTISDAGGNYFGSISGVRVESAGTLVGGLIRSSVTSSVTNGTTYALTFVWEPIDTDNIYFRLDEAGVGSSTIVVNKNGTITAPATTAKGPVTVYSVREIYSGVYEACLNWTPNFTGVVTLAFGGYSTTVGDAFNAVYCQLEQGSTPSSYIPTSGSTATRAAETLTIDNPPWPSGSPGSRGLAVAMDGLATGQNSTFVNWTLDVNNGIQITSGASDFTFTQEAGGVVDSVTGGSYSSGINVPFSIASRHGDNFIDGAVDGTALTANLTPTILPDLSSTPILISSTFNGFIDTLRIWDVDLTDAGIAEASS